MILDPIQDKIVAIPEKAATQSRSGIFLGDGNNREQPRLAKAVAVGSKVMDIKAGDRFIFQAFAASEFKIGDDDFIGVREEFVITKVKDEK